MAARIDPQQPDDEIRCPCCWASAGAIKSTMPRRVAADGRSWSWECPRCCYRETLAMSDWLDTLAAREVQRADEERRRRGK